MKFGTNLLLILTTLSVASCTSSHWEPVEDVVSKTARGYSFINKHLEKHVKSENPAANMAELTKFMNSKLFWVTGGSFKRELRQFLDLPEATINKSRCDLRGIELLEINNDGLNSKTRIEQPNYPLGRIDRLMEYYHFQYALMCADWLRYLWEPNTGYGFKQVAYERINQFLEQQGDSDTSPEHTIELVQRQLGVWEKENKDGALTDAARQIVALTSVLNENKCSYRAFVILYKNELASRQRQLGADVKRLNGLFNHYAREHAKSCSAVYPEKFKTAVKQLDEITLRSVLILTSEFYFQYRKFAFAASPIDHSNYKRLNGDFTTPQVVTLMTRQAQIPRTYLNKDEFEMKYYTTNKLLLDSLRLILTEKHADYHYLSRAMRSEDRAIHVKKFTGLYVKYILEPCRRFAETMDKDIFIPQNYDSNRIPSTVASRRDELTKGLSFFVGKSASALCSIVLELGLNQAPELVRAL